MAVLQFLLGLLGTVIILLAVLRNSKDTTARYVVSYGVYILSTLLTTIITIPLFLWRIRSTKNPRTASIFFNIFTSYMDVDWTLRNAESIKKDEAAIIVSNHQSIFDVVGLSLLLHHIGDFTAILKKQLLYIPIVGFWGWCMGLMFIDRKQPKGALRTMEETSQLMKTNKAKLWVFAEGTRGDGKRLLPFKKGAFITAIRTQTPIIPIVYSPYRSIIDLNSTADPEDRRMIVSVLEKIPTSGLTDSDVPVLMAKTHEAIEVEFQKLTAELSAASFQRSEKLKQVY